MKETKEKITFKKGDNIECTYKHFLNSTTFTWITKKGKFIRKIISKRKYSEMDWEKKEYCLVHFDGNKNPSKVEITEIKKNGKRKINLR